MTLVRAPYLTGRRLGLTLAEIKHIISLRRSGAAPCAHVRRLLTQKEADLKALAKGGRTNVFGFLLRLGARAIAGLHDHVHARRLHVLHQYLL